MLPFCGWACHSHASYTAFNSVPRVPRSMHPGPCHSFPRSHIRTTSSNFRGTGAKSRLPSDQASCWHTLAVELQSTSSNSDSTSSWLVESLEDEGSITRDGSSSAGEGDLIPEGGLSIASFVILPSSSKQAHDDSDDLHYPIYLLLGRNGW